MKRKFAIILCSCILMVCVFSFGVNAEVWGNYNLRPATGVTGWAELGVGGTRTNARAETGAQTTGYSPYVRLTVNAGSTLLFNENSTGTRTVEVSGSGFSSAADYLFSSHIVGGDSEVFTKSWNGSSWN